MHSRSGKTDRSGRGGALFGLLAAAALLAPGCAREEGPERALPGERSSTVASRARREPRPPLEIPADAPLVAVLGDSIAAGLHLAADDAFPAALQRVLAAEGRPFELLNAGVSGDTSAGGLRRVEHLMQSKPDVVIVELGANDGLRGTPLEQLESNLRTIVQVARDGGARVLLVGMQMPPNLGPDYTRGFQAVYSRVATEQGVVFAPEFLRGVGGEADMNLEDGIHPTAAGHEQLARNLAPILGEMLAEIALQ